jgi:hypothetical protein
MIWKALLIGLLLAIGEVINGNIRVRILHGIFGKRRAKVISFFSGIGVIALICWITLPWINPSNYQDCILIGISWLVMMTGLDVYFGRRVFKLNWSKVLDDFNPIKGNLLGVGMIFLLFSPSLVYWLKQ